MYLIVIKIYRSYFKLVREKNKLEIKKSEIHRNEYDRYLTLDTNQTDNNLYEQNCSLTCV